MGERREMAVKDWNGNQEGDWGEMRMRWEGSRGWGWRKT